VIASNLYSSNSSQLIWGGEEEGERGKEREKPPIQLPFRFSTRIRTDVFLQGKGGEKEERKKKRGRDGHLCRSPSLLN